MDLDARYRQPRSTRATTARLEVKLDVQFRSSRNASEELSTTLDRADLFHNGTNISIKTIDRQSEKYSAEVSSLAGIIKTTGQFLSNATYSDMRELAKAMNSINKPFSFGEVRVEWDGPFVASLRPGRLETWLPFFDKVLSNIHQSRLGVRGRKPDWLSNFEIAVRQLRAVGASTGEDEPPTPKLAAIRRLSYLILSEVNAAFDECKAALATYWKRVRYLGPLRHQPQRFYQFDDTGGVDIGVSGEFTVQVLSLEANHKIEATGLIYDGRGMIELSEPNPDTLLSLTNKWLQAMDLQQVEPISLRQSLYELKVGSLGVSLPDVGFGVSQVLPIIVECLRASKGDLIILEQPEIHLHPRVQASLADFFISRSKDGIVFVIESHSEYMIKRLCRRMAENSDPWISKSINITFVSQSQRDVSRCERIEMNEYGEVINWPSGFFDTQEDLYWTQAALRRRMPKRG